MPQDLIARSTTTVAAALAERCDGCGAAAKIRVELSDEQGELAFCGHHANRFSNRILAVADRIVVESGFEWWGTGVDAA
jgi:hypothetical protein